MARYKLKLKQLDFVSLVDDPAQPNAKCLLIKNRKKGVGLEGVARLVKTSDELGLAFFWAFTSTNPDGSDHYDLHDDNVLSDSDMIKAAAEFMEKGGAVDEMHDSVQTARVVFAMPMTPEIAKAFGVETKTSGLMLAVRPSADALAKLKSGEYTGVSIAGLGERVEAHKARPVLKQLFTTETDGHQHTLMIHEDGSCSTSWATSAGAEYGHSHAVVRGEDGTLTILADSGHTHEIEAGQAGVLVVPADVVVVQARATTAPRITVEVSSDRRDLVQGLAAKSTQQAAKPQGQPTTEGSKMPTELELAQKQQIADLEKRIALIQKLSATEHALWKSLTVDDANAFLAKSVNDRAPLVAEFEKANAIDYTADDGTVYRKNDDPRVISLAKRADAETRKRVDVEVAKRAADIFGHIAGPDDARTDLLKAIEREPDGTKREAMLGVIKSAAALSKDRAVAKGTNPGSDPEPTSKRAELKTAVEEYAKANGGLQYEAALVKALKSDTKIRDLYEQVRNEN